MSWASHNPEAYDEIVRKGVLNFLDKQMQVAGFEVPGQWLEGYEAFIEAIQYDNQFKGIWNELTRLAVSDIVHAEQDYFSSKYGG